MTRERDRIQENANKYIVKNCPAILRMTKICDAYETTWDLPQFCKDCTDCVIKQVIEKCRYAIDVYDNERFYIDDKDICLGESCLAHRILDLFDIEEINKWQKK